MRNVLTGVLFGLLASQSPGAVRAVIPNCCVSSGTISVFNPTTGAIEHTFATGTVTAGSQFAYKFAIANGGRSAAVVNATTGTTDAYSLNIVDLATGEISAHSALPGTTGLYPSTYPIAANPKINVLYLSYGDSSGDTHLLAIDSATLAFIRDVNLGAQVYADASLIVSPDGQTIYLSGVNQVAAVATSNLELIGMVPLPSSEGGIYSYAMVVSPDSSTLYVGYSEPSFGYVIAFIDTHTLQVVQTYSPSGGVPGGLTGISPDGSQLYLIEEDTGPSTLILILNIATGAITTIPIPSDVNSVAVSPNGLVYLAGVLNVPNLQLETSPTQMIIFDPASQGVTTAPLLSSGWFLSVQLAVSPDGGHVYCLNVLTSSLALAAVPPSEAILDTVQMGTTVSTLGGAYDRKDNLILLPDGNWHVIVFDAASLRLNGLLYIQGLDGSIVFGDAGYVPAADAALGARVVQFDPATFEVTGSVALSSGYQFYSFSQPALNGHRLYVPFSSYGYAGGLTGIAVIDTAQMTLVATWPFDVLPYLAVAPDGVQGYVLHFPDGAHDASLTKINLRTGQVLQQTLLPPRGETFSAMVLSPDGSTIYLSMVGASVDGTLYAISSQSLTIVNSASGYDLSTLTVSPDGDYLYGAGVSQCPSCVTSEDIISTSSLQLVGTIASALPPGPVVFIEQ